MSWRHSSDPFYYVDRDRERQHRGEDRRARYRGFRDAAHFLALATERGPNESVTREYRIIFMGESLDLLPFPKVEAAA